MDEPETSRRRRFDLPAITVLAALAVVACFAAWKWAEAAIRDKYLNDLVDRGACRPPGVLVDEWSTEWPFHNVERISAVALVDGRFTDDDVRRLRHFFPGVLVHHRSLFLGACRRDGPADLVKLPGD